MATPLWCRFCSRSSLWTCAAFGVVWTIVSVLTGIMLNVQRFSGNTTTVYVTITATACSSMEPTFLMPPAPHALTNATIVAAAAPMVTPAMRFSAVPPITTVSSAVNGSSPYFFVVANGTTRYRENHSPPASADLTTATTRVIVSPLPLSANTSDDGATTTFWSTSTRTRTLTRTTSLPPTSMITKTVPGGWNLTIDATHRRVAATSLPSLPP